MNSAENEINDLVQQLAEDGVAMDHQDATLHDELMSALEYAEHPTGVVVIEDLPEAIPNIRDFAGELLKASEMDTIILRTPFAGSVVSDVYSRSEIESAERSFLGNEDYPEATAALLQDLRASEPVDVPFLGLMFGAITLAAASAVAWKKSRKA